MDALLDTVLPFAQQTLEKYGAFHPIGAVMKNDGEISLVAGVPESPQAVSADVVEMLIAGMSQRAVNREIRASVVCFDGRVIPPGVTEQVDAICVHLEHVSDEHVAVFLPYRKKLFGKLTYGELFASPLDPRVFAATAF